MSRTTVHRVTATFLACERPETSGLDIELEVDGIVTFTEPSGFNGPPENYDPGDTEVEVLSITHDGALWDANDADIERAEEALIAKANNE